MWLNISSITNVALICQWDAWTCIRRVSASVRRLIFVSVRIRACSEFKRFLCFVLIEVMCFRVPLKRLFAYPCWCAYTRFKTTGIGGYVSETWLMSNTGLDATAWQHHRTSHSRVHGFWSIFEDPGMYSLSGGRLRGSLLGPVIEICSF
jgi:hypothetical protein